MLSTFHGPGSTGLLLNALPIKTTSIAANLKNSYRQHDPFSPHSKIHKDANEETYAAVAENISTLLALLKTESKPAKAAVNSIVKPIRAFVDVTLFSANMVSTGTTEETIMETTLLARLIPESEYDTRPDSSSITVPVLLLCPIKR
jgi:hypothetical protein